MIGYVQAWPALALKFWASPHHAMRDVFGMESACAERAAQKLKVFAPGFPRDDPPPEPPVRPARPFPTDVPAPEPRDVPAPEPHDIPPPEPGKVPPVVKPSKSPDKESKPRPVP